MDTLMIILFLISIVAVGAALMIAASYLLAKGIGMMVDKSDAH